MPIQSLKYKPFLNILLWLGFSIIAWYLAQLRLQALDFHTRDYAFYTEFIMKLGQPSNEHYYSINPGGHNFLTNSVVEGSDGFYQWVHVEPIRFIQAFIYMITGSVSVVFLFNALAVCSPILGFAKMTSKRSGFFVFLAWIILFVAFPATMLAPGYDNRPSVFLGVGYFWILFTYLRTQSQLWQFLSYFLLFLIREEALILNAVVCLFVFMQVVNKKSTFFFFIMHVLTWIGYSLAIFKYYQFWNYQLFVSSTPQFTFGTLFIGGVIGVIYLCYIFIKRKWDHLLFLPIIVFLAQLVSLYLHKELPGDPFTWYNDPRWILIWPIVMGFFLYLKRNKLTPYLTWSLAVFFIIVSVVGKGGLIQRIESWEMKTARNQELFELNKTIPSNTILLTDYTTHQCFIGKSQLFCVDRLPCYFAEGGHRFYPDNKDKVKELLEPGTYIIVTTPTANNILPWVQEKGFKWNMNPEKNFQIIEL